MSTLPRYTEGKCGVGAFPLLYCISSILYSWFRASVLIKFNKMQQYADIYLLQVYSTCFRRPSRPSSGVQKTVTTASGTGHSNSATTFLQRGL